MTETHETRIANLEKCVNQLKCRNVELWVVVAFLLGAQFASGWTFWQFLFAVLAAASLMVFIVRRSPGFSLDKFFGLSEHTDDSDSTPQRPTN